MEIDREILSAIILLLPLIHEGLQSVTSKSMCTDYGLTSWVKHAQEKCFRLTDHIDVTAIAVDWDVISKTKQTKIISVQGGSEHSGSVGRVLDWGLNSC